MFYYFSHFLKELTNAINTHYVNNSVLTSFHAFIIIICHRFIVWFVYGSSEALVAASSSDDSWARAVEGNVPIQSHLSHGCLQAF